MVSYSGCNTMLAPPRPAPHSTSTRKRVRSTCAAARPVPAAQPPACPGAAFLSARPSLEAGNRCTCGTRITAHAREPRYPGWKK
eukprot:364286-Chlamydomonas_euryale.AAC.2